MRLLFGLLWLMPSVSLMSRDVAVTLREASAGEEKVVVAMNPWFDAEGFTELRAALSRANPTSAAEWNGLALIKSHLFDHEGALAAWEQACSMAEGVNAEMWLALAAERARHRSFDESLEVLDRIDLLQLPSAKAREVLWLLLGISDENEQEERAVQRVLRILEARPQDSELHADVLKYQTTNDKHWISALEWRQRIASWGKKGKALLVPLVRRYEARRTPAHQQLESAAADLALLPEESEAETDVLEQLAQVVRVSPAAFEFAEAHESLVKRMPGRPAVVRWWAALLREQGRTRDALSYLAETTKDAGARRMESVWAAEDDREPSIPMPKPAKTAGAKDLLAWKAPDWASKIVETWDTSLSPLNKKLLLLMDLRSGAPFDYEAALLRIGEWRRAGRFAEIMHEVLWPNQSRSLSYEQRLEWWKRTGSVDGTAWLLSGGSGSLPGYVMHDAAYLEFERNRTSQRWVDRAKSPLWKEVVTDLRRGMVGLAWSRMIIHGQDASLDAELAGYLGAGLMAWRHWREAADFLQTQQARYPTDYRLAFLHAQALQVGGDTAAAEAAFLSLAGFKQEIRRSPALYGTYNRWAVSNTMSYSGASDALMSINLVPDAAKYREQGGQWLRWIEDAEYATSSFGGLPAFGPDSVSEAHAQALVELLVLAQGRDEAARRDMAERARAAGLPMPELLEAASLQPTPRQGNLLQIDQRWVDSHLHIPWVAERWLSETIKKNAYPSSEALAAAARDCAAAHAGASPRIAMDAAILAWRTQPQHPMVKEVANALRSWNRDMTSRFRGCFSLEQFLHELPIEERRKWAPELVPAVVEAAELSRAATFDRAEWVTVLGWLGAWREVARLWVLPNPGIDSMCPPEADEWFGLHTAPLHWPPREWNAFVSAEQEKWLPETEKAAFLEAVTEIKTSRERAAWLFLGGDHQGAAMEVRKRQASQPASLMAALDAASLLEHEGQQGAALDLLHDCAVRQPRAALRQLGLRLYAQAAMFPRRYSTSENVKLRDVPPGHAERLAKAAAELLDSASHHPNAWPPVWKTLFLTLKAGKEDDIERMCAKRRWPEHWQGHLGVRNQLLFCRSSPADEPFPLKVEVAEQLLAAGKRDQTVELLLREFRREADTRFLKVRRSYIGTTLDGWREFITRHSLAETLLHQVKPRREDFRHLLQAAHVAEACQAWDSVGKFVAKALKIDPAATNLSPLLAEARRRGYQP